MAEEKKTSEQVEEVAEKAEKKAEKAEKKPEKKAAKKPAKKNKTNPFKSIVAFFKSVKSEGKKVVWAKPKDVLRNTIIVLIVVFIAGLAIFAVDTVLTKGMGAIKDLAAKEETTTEAVVDDTVDEDYDLVEEETTTEAVEEAAE